MLVESMIKPGSMGYLVHRDGRLEPVDCDPRFRGRKGEDFQGLGNVPCPYCRSDEDYRLVQAALVATFCTFMAICCVMIWP